MLSVQFLKAVKAQMPNLIYIYIYKTETFEAPTIFHIITILKKINK